MYTKARIAGHPIHPMLVAFPIGLYAATVAALLAFVGTHDGFFFRAAMTANIAGVVMAAVATIPGAIDLLSLPRGSKARGVGFVHAGFNVLSLALFAMSAGLLYTRWGARPFEGGYFPINADALLDATGPLALTLAGLVSTVIAGGLGWALVQTHHVGVKPRFDGRRAALDNDDLLHSVAGRYESHAHH